MGRIKSKLLDDLIYFRVGCSLSRMTESSLWLETLSLSLFLIGRFVLGISERFLKSDKGAMRAFLMGRLNLL